MTFWIKPIGDVSLFGDTGRFFPSLSFLSKISPPQHNLHFGYWVNPNGEARINTQCLNTDNKNTYWNVEMKAASNDDWTFLAIAHKNRTSVADRLQHTMVYTNLGINEEYLDGPTVSFAFAFRPSFLSEHSNFAYVMPILDCCSAASIGRLQALNL